MRGLIAAWLLLFVSWAQAQQYRSEVKVLEVAPPAQQAPEDPAAMLKRTTDPYARSLLLRELAARAARDGDAAAAASYLEQALAQGGLSEFAAVQMRNDLTRLYAASGRHDEVVRVLGPRLQRNEELSAEELISLGAAYLQLERHRDAIAPIRAAIAKHPRPDESWRAALLSAYIGAKQYEPASALVAELVREYPARGDYWLQWVALLMRAGNKERAAAVLALAARQGHVNTEEDRMRLVSVTASVGAIFEAGSLMQRWMVSGELAATADNFESLAGLWSNAREWSLAVEALEQALALRPRAALYLQLGQLYMDREDYAQAAQALDTAIQRGVATGPVFMSLGMAEYQQGQIDPAINAFRSAQQFKASQSMAAEWVKYLESGGAREKAMQAALNRAQRDWGDQQVQLASSPDGKIVQLGGSANPVEDGRRLVSRDPFTPVGAERPGNADGTIPAWDGGLIRQDWPKGFAPGQKIMDPFPADQPLFEISARNVAEYGNKVSDGHRTLMERYPDYRLPVYPTRRSVGYPQAIYDATKANQATAKLKGSDALSEARLGFPFPRPENGVEIMWNHRTRYRGDTVKFQAVQAVVHADGKVPKSYTQNWKAYYRYANVEDPVDIERDNILVYGVTWLSDGGRNPNFVVLFHETANSILKPRNLWVLLVKIGRMLRIPPVGYDQPFPESDGLYFIDQIDMYNGAFDRYVWRLVGKREMYIPYNSYKLNDGRYKYGDLLKGRFLNPDATRYELHRVWVIEATERGNKRHVFGKRMFYVDEDSWNVVMVENYDREGSPWRFQEGHMLQFYEAQASYSAPVVVYDLKDGRYFANFLTAEEPPPEYNTQMDNQDFLPARIKTRYSR